MALSLVETFSAAQEEVRDSIVKILDEYRERAMRGEYSGVAICGVLVEGNPDSAVSKSTDRLQLVAAVALLNHRVLTRGPD